MCLLCAWRREVRADGVSMRAVVVHLCMQAEPSVRDVALHPWLTLHARLGHHSSPAETGRGDDRRYLEGHAQWGCKVDGAATKKE